MKKYTSIFLICFMSSCIMPESYLKQTELYGANGADVLKKRNKVWLKYQDDDGTPRTDNNNVHIYEYKFQKTKIGFQVASIKAYDINFNPVDSNSDIGYFESVTKYYRNGKIKEQKFLTKDGRLIPVNYLNYARQTNKYEKNGEWIENYYDANNNPRCGDLGYEIKMQWDTVQYIHADTLATFLRINEVYKLHCNGDTIQ